MESEWSECYPGSENYSLNNKSVNYTALLVSVQLAAAPLLVDVVHHLTQLIVASKLFPTVISY